MVSTAQSVWWSRLATLFLAALAAGSAVYWVLLWPGSPTVSGGEMLTEVPAVDTAAVSRALGGGAIASPAAVDAGVLASSRFALAGVVAERSDHGAALISVDGKAAKPFRVGAIVVDGWILRQVQARKVVLSPIAAQGQSDAGADVALELPRPKGVN